METSGGWMISSPSRIRNPPKNPGAALRHTGDILEYIYTSGNTGCPGPKIAPSPMDTTGVRKWRLFFACFRGSSLLLPSPLSNTV